ncbi:MAG: glycogen-debranching protein [Verrucomicrobiae bacterium]|nr:glycogen-debranching protein [Verrucomicrobiae bacterium]
MAPTPPSTPPPRSAPTPAGGQPWPLGVVWIPGEDAFNFSIYSRHADRVTLLLFAETAPETPLLEVPLRHPDHRSGNLWHCRLPARELAGAGCYAWRIEGPWAPDQGHRFDAGKVLLDPYAPSVFFPPGYSRDACATAEPTVGRAPLGRLPQPRPEPSPMQRGPRHPISEAIIYELHVKGFTARENSGVAAARRGTFDGLVDKIPYLKELGVTIVELLPVQQFDPQEGNYWGYMTLHFFSPHHAYSASGDAPGEFRRMVEAFHAAGIEVWMDVVYNHSSEGDSRGPTYSFRGIDNDAYYLLQADRSRYVNDTGCGNTLRTGHPAMRVLILQSLAYWAGQLGVDGFRFDLASIFSRADDGTMGRHESALISEVSFLARQLNLRLVAEAWDISSNQLGRGFPGMMWLQWNGLYRDDIRSFVRGEGGRVGALMRRLYGSDDLFPDGPRDTCRPYQSVNFVTAHDGFCLHDLLAYDQRHNEANGHGNTDGTPDNRSWNCGWEGEDGAPAGVVALRRRQAKNVCALLMLANGVPMFPAGDEFLNTQGGNNNPYNQDNETTWLDWSRLETHREVHRFFQRMIAFRKSHPSIARPTFWRSDVEWSGPDGTPDWGPESRHLAYRLRGGSAGVSDLYVMINGHWDDREFLLPPPGTSPWRVVVDTAEPPPGDVPDPDDQRPLDRGSHTIRARSVVVLETAGAPP